jgi:hypothetical protein
MKKNPRRQDSSASSAPVWVGFFVDFFHLGGGDMGVDLGGGDAGVAEEFLDKTKVCAIAEQVSCK